MKPELSSEERGHDLSLKRKIGDVALGLAGFGIGFATTEIITGHVQFAVLMGFLLGSLIFEGTETEQKLAQKFKRHQ